MFLLYSSQYTNCDHIFQYSESKCKTTHKADSVLEHDILITAQGF